MGGPPVLSLRDAGDRAAIAERLAEGQPAAFYLGLFTVVKLLRPPWREGDSGLFWRVKPARPGWSKLPMLALPRHSVRLLDPARLHPAVRPLARREAWEGIWRSVGAPLHVIAPVRRPLRWLHPAVATTPDDLAAFAADRPAARDRVIGATTAACFWFDDPDWNDLAERLVRRATRGCVLGGTSFNEHGAHPPYTLAELEADLAARPDVPVELVVTDERIEAAGVFGSHTMVRLPLVGEEPALVLAREGSVGEAWLEEALGLPVRRLESTATAARRPGTTAEEIERCARSLAGATC